jgi:hypothetical protein
VSPTASRRAAAGDLVAGLVAAAPRFGDVPRAEKLRLLSGLAEARIPGAARLARLHEALCFIRAYPDDAAVEAAAEAALRGFAARVRRLSAAARARLSDSGIAGTDLDYPFGLRMAAWLAARFPSDVEVAWRRFARGEQLEEALSLLVTTTEGEAFTEGGLGWRRWLRLARGRRASDLETLLGLFRTAPMPDAVREWLFETLELPIVWRLRGAAPSRTLVRLPAAPAVHHRDGLRRDGFDLAREIRRPLPPPRRAGPRLAAAVLDAARASMATRARELHAFASPNADDVLVVDPGRGLRVALVGLRPDDRLPLDAYYAYVAFKNGVPISYGGGWGCLGTLEFALNIFESFRQGESAFTISQILRAYFAVFRMRRVVVDRSQIDATNPEALHSGAFYFYAKLGFRPVDPEVDRLAATERARVAREPGYRSPLPVLRSLGRSSLVLTLDGGPPEPALTGSRLAELVTSHVTRAFDGNRRAATADAVARVARALGANGRRRWAPPERRAFERLALVMGLIPGLARWPAPERARVREVLRAKGGVSEATYVARLDAHRRLGGALRGLGKPAPS